MSKRILFIALTCCALVASLATGCNRQSNSGSKDLSLGSGVSSGLDLVNSMFGGSMKTSISADGEDTDLKVALLVESDLPPGYARSAGMGDMRLTGDTPAGTMRAIARMFGQADPANPLGGSSVTAMVYSGLPSGVFDSKKEKESSDKSGLYKSTEIIETPGLGESASALRRLSDLGVAETFMWSRGDLTYTLFVMYPEDWPTPADGLSLAYIMDKRAKGEIPPGTAHPTVAAAVPTTVPGTDPSSLFLGATPKMDSDTAKVDPDLAKALLTADDLPDDFAALVKDMHLSYETAAGPVDGVVRMFMKSESSSPLRGATIMEYGFPAAVPSTSTDCEGTRKMADQLGVYKSVQELDSDGLGEKSCGTRIVSDAGTMDTYVWSRSSRSYMLMISVFGDTSESIDGLALAKITDGRAQGQSN